MEAENDIKKQFRLGKYRHFKGMEYNVIAIAKHSETLEDMVVYEALYNNPVGKLWVRPLNMFIEKVEKNGNLINRFTFIEQ